MNSSENHIGNNVLHFNRWSNKSYAIFNSIGKLVHIGFLSRIIQKLITVKSFFFNGLLTIIHELVEKEENKNIFIGEVEAPFLLPISLFDSLIAETISNRNECSVGTLYSYILVNKIKKAFRRSFFMLDIHYLFINRVPISIIKFN